MQKNHFCCALLIALLASIPARAEDWPAFRGPTFDGHTSERLPLEWSATRGVRWKQAIPGNGWSSPVIVGQRIYLTTAVPQPESPTTAHDLRLIILNRDDGQAIRSISVFKQSPRAPQIHKKNSHASPTPIVDGDHVFVHFGHQGTACLTLDGDIVWRTIELEYPPVHGNGGSPVIVGNSLIFSCDGARDPFVVALDKRTGDIRWQTPRKTNAAKKFSFSTPTVIEVDGRIQVVSPGSNAVCAFDPETGDEIWRVRYDGYSVIPKPVFANGLVYVCTGFNRAHLLAIRPDGKGDVTKTHVVFDIDRNVPKTPSLILKDKLLFMVDDRGIASCLDAMTGENHWQQRLGGNHSASPLLAGDRVYFQSEEGDTVVVAASKRFQRLAKNSIGERTLASYGVADGAIYLRSADHLYRIE